MIGNKAQMISKHISASNGQGTMPVGRSYFCIQSHELQNDLEDMAGWLSVENYPSGMGSYDSEVGALTGANMRYLITQNGKIWTGEGGTSTTGYRYTSSNVDVYASLVFGQKAVGKVPLDGASLRSIVKDVGSGGASDPLDQRGSTGWKAFSAWVILNDLWLCRGEFACTL
jgi:N4-gp56 family major capsid protein